MIKLLYNSSRSITSYIMSVNLSELNLHVSHFQDCSVSNLLQNMKVNFLIFNHEWDPANREEISDHHPPLCEILLTGVTTYTKTKILITITITITREIENVNLFSTLKIPNNLFNSDLPFLPNQNVLNPSVGLTLVLTVYLSSFFSHPSSEF